MNVKILRRIVVLSLTLLLLALPIAVYAAAPQQSGPPPSSEVDEALANMTYISDYTESGVVELESGQFEDADNLIFATLANRPRAYGDVDGNGTLDAVVWLATNTGGSGVFVDLAAVLDVETEPVNAAITFLGDRTLVQSIEIDEEGAITIELVTQGSEDPMCCPTQIARATYILDSGVLAMTSSEMIGTVGEETEADDVSSEVVTDTAELTETVALTEEVATDEVPLSTAEPVDVTVAENPFDEGILENATYLSEHTEDGEVTLVDGVFEDTANRIHVELVAEPRLYGDVDGDGVADALVLLYANTGGSGGFVDLAVILNQDGVAYNADSDLLGDRVQVESLALAAGGAITVRMITQGPDDAMCCPTLLVERNYAFADDTLTLVEEIDVLAAEAAAAEALASTPASELTEFAPAAQAIAATLTLDGSPISPNPALVAVIGGPGDLEAIDAATQGAECAGWIPPAPDVVVNWSGESDALRFFTIGEGDPTLLVVAPDGDVLCNDDMQTSVFNPLVVVDDPQPGRYAVYVGIYDPSIAPATSLLAVTTRELDPLTYTVALPALAAEATDDAEVEDSESGSASPAAESNTLLPDDGPARVTIGTGELPVTVELVAGGPVSVFEQPVGNSLCTGFASAAPVYQFALDASGGAINELVLFFEAEVDTTLMIRDPYARYQCVDDGTATPNLNPWIVLPGVPGDYEVWVGTYAADTEAPGTLTIGNDSSVTPEVLAQ